MKTFTDTVGRSWTVEVNVAAVKRLRTLLGVDVVNLKTLAGTITSLIGDPVLLCNVVYVVCKPEVDRLGISDEEFGAAMGGDALENATTAFLEELAAFFPTRRRALLQQALALMDQVEAEAARLAAATLDGPELRAEIERILSTAGSSSGSSPGSSESTPTP